MKCLGFMPHGRRGFIKMIAKTGALAMMSGTTTAQPPSDSAAIHATLQAKPIPEHPRLHLRKGQWNQLRSSIDRDDRLSSWFGHLQKIAADMLSQPTTEYKLVGPRLLYESRKALARISTLAGLYRLDGDKEKADRAREELKAICAFPSWHPPHFLDVAEMTNAAALGYDWLYEILGEDERRTIRRRIIEFGLKPGLALYESDVNWSRPFANNWGQVCAGGLTVGALAIFGDGIEDPEGAASEPETILKWTTTKVRNAMMNYAPDGGWPEGPGYWSYATNYTCMMISALQSALGTDLGLATMEGFDNTGTFRVASIGPSGQFFNYADADARVGPAPEMLWLAARFNNPLYAISEVSVVEKAKPNIFHLLWSLPQTGKLQASRLPLDNKFSRIQVAYLRSSWSDPNAMFVGFKGGDNAVSHGHLDLGSFVLDALGERWALDLGPDDYDLPGYFATQRWQYYRLRSEGHNVLTIGTENQVLSATAPMDHFSSSPAAGLASVSLTDAYGPVFHRVEREVRLERSPTQRFVLTDTIEGATGTKVRWNLHSRADIRLSGRTAILEIQGKRLRAEIESPADAVFEVISANTTPPQAQQSDVHNLTIQLSLSKNSELLRVTFQPMTSI